LDSLFSSELIFFKSVGDLNVLLNNRFWAQFNKQWLDL